MTIERPTPQRRTEVSKHTPGPWSWDIANGWLVAPDIEVPEDSDLGTIVLAYCADDEGPTEADANLIAAAPDLLEACKSAIVWVAYATARDPNTTHPKAIQNAQEDLDAMRAAIAKAEPRP